MSTVHDNGRVGQLSQPDASVDLKDLIDLAGAAVAAALSVAHLAALSACMCEGWDRVAESNYLSAASDAREAAFYLRRALVDVRELL
jgi:hypothetical protein